MATRVGGEQPFMPPPGVQNDGRLDQQREQQLKQLMEHEVVRSRTDGESLLDRVTRALQGANGQGGLKVAPLDPEGVTTKRTGDQPAQHVDTATPRDPGRTAPTTELGKLVADFQRNNGLPVTGKLDRATVDTMKNTGVLAQAPAPSTSEPRFAEGPPAPAPMKVPPRPEDTAAARRARSAQDQQSRARVDGPKDVERVADPARLLASLVTAGFVGKKGALDEGVRTFQATFGLPLSGKLDPATAEAMQSHGLLSDTDVPKKTTDKPIEAKQQVRRALNDSAPTSRTAADKDVVRDPIRPQAPTQKPTTSSNVAARAPVTSTSDAADHARLDSVVAQQKATERGVQEATGDPLATQGHGEVHGEGAGEKGAGGVTGGGDPHASGPGAVGPEDGTRGEESAVGNAKAGDDAFVDEARGEGNAESESEAPGDDAEHWRVPPLSEQVQDALEKIVRDDDGTGPVTYTWDVTFLRPGVYAAGQPAEEMWRVAVNRATAFDAVWKQAAEAIATRMLYAEPDASPPTLDDFVAALRRARVR